MKLKRSKVEPRLLRLHMREEKPSIEGVFIAYEAGHYVLTNGKLLVAEGQTVPLAGETWVPVDRVQYAQEITG